MGAVEDDLPAPLDHTRIRTGRRVDAWDDDVPAGPGRPSPPPDDLLLGDPVPVPGRHAARRAVGRRSGDATGVVAARGALTGLRDRLLIGPAQLAVLAMLVLGGLLVTGWWLLRTSPAAVHQVAVTQASPLVTPAAMDADDGAAAMATSSARPGATVVVDVEGRVRRPGIVVLPAGSRVVDAVRAAGGVRPQVDLAGVNLARQVVDGEQILVGVTPPGGLAASAAATPGAPTPGVLVNLNSADQATLEGLPEVGPVTAQAIISWREEHGGFTAVDQLLDVDGIGEATLGRIAPLVTI